MEKANLLCPTEKVFFKGLLVTKPRIPVEEVSKKELETSIELEVDVLAEFGKTALILLPNILSNGKNRTATVNTQYLL